jgi:hypothetical protein
VIAALGARLELGDESRCRRCRARRRRGRAGRAGAAPRRAAVAEEDEVLHRIGFALAARWPELLDPFRADFEATLRANASAVAALLDSPEAREHARLRQETDRVT